jgi:hypothetical protein
VGVSGILDDQARSAQVTQCGIKYAVRWRKFDLGFSPDV